MNRTSLSKSTATQNNNTSNSSTSGSTGRRSINNSNSNSKKNMAAQALPSRNSGQQKQSKQSKRSVKDEVEDESEEEEMLLLQQQQQQVMMQKQLQLQQQLLLENRRHMQQQQQLAGYHGGSQLMEGGGASMMGGGMSAYGYDAFDGARSGGNDSLVGARTSAGSRPSTGGSSTGSNSMKGTIGTGRMGGGSMSGAGGNLMGSGSYHGGGGGAGSRMSRGSSHSSGGASAATMPYGNTKNSVRGSGVGLGGAGTASQQYQNQLHTSDYNATLSPGDRGSKMLSANSMGNMDGTGDGGDMTMSPNHLSHRMSLGYGVGAGSMGASGISPGFGSRFGDSAHGSGSSYSRAAFMGGMGMGMSSVDGLPMTAEDAEREEEMLLSYLIARRRRVGMGGAVGDMGAGAMGGPGMGQDSGVGGNPLRKKAGAMSLADDMALLNNQLGTGGGAGSGNLMRGSGGGSATDLLGNSSQGSTSLRMSSRGSNFYRDHAGLDYAGGMGYGAMNEYHPSMSQNSGGAGLGLGMGRHRFLANSDLSNSYSHGYGLSSASMMNSRGGSGSQLLYGRGSGAGISGSLLYGGGMSGHPNASQLYMSDSISARHEQLQAMQHSGQDLERIVRSPARLLMDARSANNGRDGSGTDFRALSTNQYASDSLMGGEVDLGERGWKRGLNDPYGPGGVVDHTDQTNATGEEMVDAQTSKQQKAKRTHKKKPADMPRRPLSAYNLFFSEERERILVEIEGGGEDDNADETKKVKVDDHDDDNSDHPDEKGGSKEVDELAGKSTDETNSQKPKALLRPLIPSQKKRRPHRKTHGKISFQTLARMVGERWKSLPDVRRQYYKDLAMDDTKRQKVAMELYYANQQQFISTDNENEADDSNNVKTSSVTGGREHIHESSSGEIDEDQPEGMTDDLNDEPHKSSQKHIENVRDKGSKRFSSSKRESVAAEADEIRIPDVAV